MKQPKKEHSDKTVGIACGLIFFLYMGCCHYLLKENKKPQIERPKSEISHYTSNIDSGQSARRCIKKIKIIPTTETYEVSQWVTSGDWSHDNYPLTVNIPSQRVVMDIDYVEDHWDDYLSDPEDEIQYPPELFQ